MKTNKYLSYFVLSTFVLLLASCEPKGLTEADVFAPADSASLAAQLKAENPGGEYKIYQLNEFLDAFMTEEGSLHNDSTPYRERSHDDTHNIYLYSIDTIRTGGPGIYISGRITTDDYAGNFYKTMIIQQIVNGEQQNLRISVDLGSSAGMYQIGQEVLIRCNGLCVGRYANQPQLCTPSYNNNIFAMNADSKVGWAAGRIPGAVFRRISHMIGLPDITKIKYDTLYLDDLYDTSRGGIALKPTADAAGMDAVRKMDGRLVVLKDVHFTGQYLDNGTLKECVVGHPDTIGGANVFAPSTQNIGYPQSRLIGDQGTKTIMCSNSEYAKFAYFYLPGADKTGVSMCKSFEGTVTGILGWYLDKAETLKTGKLTGYEWSVTPRGIPGIGIADIRMYHEGNLSEPWVPSEFKPNETE